MAQFEHLEPDMPVTERTQAILREMQRLISAAPMEVGLYLAATAGLGILFDLNGWAESGANLVVNIATIALGYVMANAMLRNSGLAPEGLTAGFGTYFGISILTGLGTLVGLVLLVIPGIVLLVRWSPAIGYGLAGEVTANGALSASWHSTGPHFWPILVALLLPAASMIAGLLIYVAPFSVDGQIGPFAIILGNVLMMASSVLGGAIGIAVFGLLAAPRSELREVFD